MQNKKIVLFTTAILAIGFVLGMVFYQKSVDKKIEQLAASDGAPFIRDHSPTMGENKNDVLIVEFLDPECESCKQFHPIIKKVFYDYKKETKLVYRYIANHKNSIFAIRVLEAAKKQDKFKETLDLVFKYQEEWSKTPKALFTHLQEIDLDMEKFKVDFDKNDISNILKTDREDANKLNFRGTPTIFVNGKALRVLSYKSLLDLVESQIYK